MADLYQAKGSIGGIFKGTTVAITLGDGTTAGAGGQKGALVQSINLTYTRNVTRIWELGSDDTYYVIGHTEGRAQLSRITAKTDSDILDDMADACVATSKKLNLRGVGDTCENGTANFQLSAGGPVVTQRSFGINTQNFLITSTAAIMFSSLEKS